MITYINSTDLVNAILESGKAPDLSTAHAYAFGMSWANLSVEQQARLIEVAKA